MALLALLVVFIPRPERSEAGRQSQGSLWSESGYGFKYILQRPSLLGLQLVFFGINFTSTFVWVLMAPMILARIREVETRLPDHDAARAAEAVPAPAG
ncbi:MAG TPA: hypothetical protein VGA07_08270 [Anaerolineales bacterium]